MVHTRDKMNLITTKNEKFEIILDFMSSDLNRLQDINHFKGLDISTILRIHTQKTIFHYSTNFTNKRKCVKEIRTKITIITIETLILKNSLFANPISSVYLLDKYKLKQPKTKSQCKSVCVSYQRKKKDVCTIKQYTHLS